MSKTRRHHRHRKPRFRRRTPPGATPGSIQPHPDALPCTVRVLAYGPEAVIEETVTDVNRLPQWLGKHPVTWVHVDGLGDADLIQRLGTLLGLHDLALEDVVNPHQRSKVEPYDSHLFLIARMAVMRESADTEQLALFVGGNYVVTFQERPGKCLAPVEERIRRNTGRIRHTGADYLAYAVLDAVVDSYFPVLDRVADRLEELEDAVASESTRQTHAQMHSVRNDLLVLRRAIRPHREALNELIRDALPRIAGETRVYLRDCYDHVVQLLELIEIYREMCSDLRDFHQSVVSNRMNEVMQVLTIIATIFIPLSFIASVYGMNFDTRQPGNMPELHWPYGYLMALGVMLATAVGMLVFFRRKRWLGGPSPPP